MMGAPVAAEAATADGNSAPNTAANVAARKASERKADQCVVEDADTPSPYRDQANSGRPWVSRG